MWLLATTMFSLVVGCAQTDLSEIYYHDEKPTCPNDYRRYATEIAFPDVESPTANEAMTTAPPRSISARHDDEVAEITLSEAIQTALQNNQIIRRVTGVFGGAGTSSILSNPTTTSSYYDPAIRDSGVLFGGRGMESALAAFDATWTTNMSWNSDSQIANTANPTPILRKVEGGNFSTELSKVFGYGGQFTLGHNWRYSGLNSTAGLFYQSAYSGRASAEFRQPLWAGAGREFTAIAGPISQGFGGLSGVTQGVLIARINGDISIADFEIDVRDMLFDVETTYWDLYLAYRRYDTTVIAFRSAYQTWKESQIKLEIGTLKASDEAQARDRFYETRAQAEGALATVFDTEMRFRRLLGMKVNDGTVLRPAEEPISAEIVVDWQAALAEALTRRVELRRQKWNIKSLQLQLKAAKSLVNPSLDFNAGYHFNGFGDQLLSSQHANANSAYETLTQGNHPGWELGLTMNVPIGFRSAHAQVRNIELRTAKAMDVLAAQELEITHELGNTIQSLARFHSVAKSNFNRLEAAQVRVDKLGLELEEGTITPDPLVRAQSSLATAETAYYLSLTNYNKSLAEFHYRRGTLLANYNIYLSEGPWCGHALCDAARRAHERANADPDEDRHEEPNSFAFPDFRTGQSDVALVGYEESGSAESDVIPTPNEANKPEASEDLDIPEDSEKSGDSKTSDESGVAPPTVDAPGLDETDTPTLRVPEVEDVPGPKPLDDGDPAAFFNAEPTFELFEQDSIGLIDFEPAAESVPVFNLRELPSRNATNDKPDNAAHAHRASTPIVDRQIEPASAEFVIEPVPRSLVEIPDWIDLRPIPGKKPNLQKLKPVTKPKLKKRTAETRKSESPTTSVRPNDSFQSWKSDDPFWVDTSKRRPTTRHRSPMHPVEFEDYRPKFHVTK